VNAGHRHASVPSNGHSRIPSALPRDEWEPGTLDSLRAHRGALPGTSVASCGTPYAAALRSVYRHLYPEEVSSLLISSGTLCPPWFKMSGTFSTMRPRGIERSDVFQQAPIKTGTRIGPVSTRILGKRAQLRSSNPRESLQGRPARITSTELWTGPSSRSPITLPALIALRSREAPRRFLLSAEQFLWRLVTYVDTATGSVSIVPSNSKPAA